MYSRQGFVKKQQIVEILFYSKQVYNTIRKGRIMKHFHDIIMAYMWPY